MMPRLTGLSLALGLCAIVPAVQAQNAQAPCHLPDYVVAQFGTPPVVPDGPLADELYDAVNDVMAHALNQRDWDPDDRGALDAIVASVAPGIAWTLTDMMRFTWRPEFNAVLTETALAPLGIEVESFRHRAEIIDHLMAWDMPAYDDYLDHKLTLFNTYVPGRERILRKAKSIGIWCVGAGF